MATIEELMNVDFSDASNEMFTPVGISNRHLHLNRADMDKLFGEGAELTNIKDLTQPGQYACKEMVTIVGPKGSLEKVRILGPLRKETQIELAQTDARKIGIKAPLRNSGDLEGTPGCILIGPKGYLVLEQGCIVARPHIHLHTTDGERLGIKDKEVVDVFFKTVKPTLMCGITARVHPQFAFDMHIDTDEANAMQVKDGDKGLIIKRG